MRGKLKKKTYDNVIPSMFLMVVNPEGDNLLTIGWSRVQVSKSLWYTSIQQFLRVFTN